MGRFGRRGARPPERRAPALETGESSSGAFGEDTFGTRSRALKRWRFTRECAACGKQTSVTAGEIMHRSHLPLKTWFTAIHILTSHSNGVSALQLQGQLGPGSDKTAWLLLQKLRWDMVDPGRSLLAGVVEIHETEMPSRRKDEPSARRPRARPDRKDVRRLRSGTLARGPAPPHPPRPDARLLRRPQALRHRRGRSRRPCRHRRLVRLYWGPDQVHDAKSVGRMAAHIVLKSTHRTFSNLKRGALGTFHGLRPQHLRRYLDEYVFRWDRCRHTVPASDTLLGIGARLAPATARDVVDQRV